MEDRENQKKTTINNDLQKRLALVGRLSAGIGHNIMTPLSLIMMNSDLLSMKIDAADPLQHHLKEITNQATIISKIAETMMWKVKTEEQETPSLFQVGALLLDNLDFWMGDMFFKHKLEKKFDINPQTPPIKSVPYYFTSFVDEWIQWVIERAKDRSGESLSIVVDEMEGNRFFIQFEDSLPTPPASFLDVLREEGKHPRTSETFPALSRLLTHHPASVEVTLPSHNEGLKVRFTWSL